jgi:crotonobetainyl-CoA:carnitine CoA-transferase CaiB-like acyl-CoA transferase
MMADLGAEVLKIEPPGGELGRHVGPFRHGVSAFFSQLNCGKKCLALDLKRPAAVEIVKQLVHTYDVVVENFSPGVMARLGLDYECLRRENPALVLCSISGYGQTGPGAQRPAYAATVQAWTGFERVYLHYQPGLAQPLNMGPPAADTTASLQALCAINGALFYRQRTGQGQHLDIAMFDALISTMAKDFQQVSWPSTPDRLYGPLPTIDGFILVMPLTQKHLENLAACMQQPELLHDPRFATTSARLIHYQEFMHVIGAWVRAYSSSEALARLEAAHIPCAAYRSLQEAVADPQVAHRGMLAEVEDAAGPLTVLNTPFLFSHTQASVRPWVARLGQHNGEILTTVLGYTAAQIAALEAEGSLVST